MKERIIFLLGTIFLGKLILTKELNLLIHPRYFWLVYIAAVIMAFFIFLPDKKHEHHKHNWFIYLLGIFFIGGSLITLKPLSSSANAHQTSSDIINNTQYSRNKRLTSFTVNTEERSLIDWVTMFSLNPEPSKYEGQKIKVTGFYFLDENGDGLIARYAVSCCIADARILGIPLSEKLNYDSNTWLEISGNIQSAEKDGQRYSEIKVSSQQIIPTPDDPYITN